MAGINEKYDIEIEVLTPLSIGAGAEKDWVRGVDFVIKGNLMYKLNLKKMVGNGMDMSKISDFFASKDESSIIKLIGNKLETVSDFSISAPVDSQNDIKVFVKNQLSGNAVLAGSSMKGAIRSILFQYLGGTTNNGKEVFGSSTNGDEFMRFIKFSDAEFDKTELVNTKIFNLRDDRGWKGGWKIERNRTNENYQPTGFNTIYESIAPHQKGDATIMLASSVFDTFEQKVKAHINSAKKRPILNNGINNLFSIINNHTRSYLEKEKAFFLKYTTDKTDRIIDSIEDLLSQIPIDNSYCILKMSAGSGFHSITGDWQFEDYSINGLDTTRKVSRGLFNSKGSAKSRKIAIVGDSFSLMGFVKLRPLSEDEKQTKETERQEKIREKQEKQEKQKQQKLEEEKRLAAEKQRKADYDLLIKKAEELFSNSEFDNALTEIKNAADLFPDGKQHGAIMNKIESELNRIQKENEWKELQLKNEQEAKERLQQKIVGGLACLDEKFEFGDNTGKYKVKDFKVAKSKIEDWLKKSQNQTIPDDQIEILQKTLKRIFQSITKDKEKSTWLTENDNVWRDVERWIGKEKVSIMYKSVVNQNCQ